VVIQELEDFIEMLVLSRLDIRSQLFQSAFRLGFTVAMIEDSHPLPTDVMEKYLKINGLGNFKSVHRKLLIVANGMVLEILEFGLTSRFISYILMLIGRLETR
jgi:hypothetical protein